MQRRLQVSSDIRKSLTNESSFIRENLGMYSSHCTYKLLYQYFQFEQNDLLERAVRQDVVERLL